MQNLGANRVHYGELENRELLLHETCRFGLINIFVTFILCLSVNTAISIKFVGQAGCRIKVLSLKKRPKGNMGSS